VIKQKSREATHRKIFVGLTLALAFAIPAWKNVLPWIIALLLLNWLIEGKYVKTFPLVFREKTRLLTFSFSLLFFIYLAGLVHTENFRYAGEDLLLKLSILVFPMIYATSTLPLFTRKEAGMILRAFGAGCIVGSAVLLARAFYQSAIGEQPGAFYYTSLGWNFHPSYYAMYLAFAMSNILCFFILYRQVNGLLNVVIHILILLLFTVMIVLLSSKAGLMIWISTVCIYAGILIFKYRRWVSSMVFTAIAFSVFVILLLVFPTAIGRVSQAKDDMAATDSTVNSGRSTNDRVLIWKSSKEIIRQNYLFGVGTGDVRDELTESYKRNDVLAVMKHYLNAHNQYVQTLIAVGLPGLIVLISMILFPAIFSIRRANYIYFAFLFIAGASMFFESMFERQEGVVFYAFFNTFLLSLADEVPE
jgi:O-antigen ligase